MLNRHTHAPQGSGNYSNDRSKTEQWCSVRNLHTCDFDRAQEAAGRPDHQGSVSQLPLKGVVLEMRRDARRRRPPQDEGKR